MKVIDLLNKIANDEEMPRTIIYEGSTYEYRRDLDDYEYYNEFADHYDYLLENPYGKAYSEFYNDEVEIIEEDKKIEKIEKLYKYLDKDDLNEEEKDKYYENVLKVYDDSEYCINESMSFVVDKINEIIDYINEVEQWK